MPESEVADIGLEVREKIIMGIYENPRRAMNMRFVASLSMRNGVDFKGAIDEYQKLSPQTRKLLAALFFAYTQHPKDSPADKKESS